METIREIQKSIQHPGEDVKNSDIKYYISYIYTTTSTGNTEELVQRKINITAEKNTQKYTFKQIKA